MAIESVVIDRDSRKASISWPQGNPQYQVRFIVTSTEVLDGVESLGYPEDPNTGTRVPEPGDAYEDIGNDTNRNMVVKNISVSQISGTVWAYDVTYAPFQLSLGGTTNQPGETEPKTPTGDPPKDWTEIGPDINVQMVQRSRPAEKGAYIGKEKFKFNPYGLMGFRNEKLHHQQGWNPQNFAEPVIGGRLTTELANAQPIVNSAHKAFDPPVEVDYTRLLLTITRMHHSFPTNLLIYQDSVNRFPFRFNINGFQMAVPMFSVKVQGITGSAQWQNKRRFWRVDYICEVDLYRGWRVDILDRGKTELIQNEETAQYEDHLILDEKGHPVNEPALLNGQGRNARRRGTTPTTQVGAYLRYAVYPERDFTPLRFDDPNP